MQYLKIKDFKNRKFVYLTEKKNLIKKIIFINFLNFFSNRFKKKRSIFLYLFFKKFKIFNPKNKINRRCIISNRKRGIIRPYNVSRIVFKELVYFGLLPGYKKAVW
jgi:small subunit ribosomal protein S14